MNSSRSWVVWGAAVAAYVVAVLQRSSLGVAGVEAADRFGISASALSSLGIAQIIVYAALQVPVGVLLDRLGPKMLISVGATLMLFGQFTLAFSTELPIALLGRILVGAGDATTFISVIRLLSFWFGGRLLPQVSQWTGNIGQLGQVASVLPFSWLLQTHGWTVAFSAAGLASAVVLSVVLVLVSNGRDDAWRSESAGTVAHALRQFSDAVRRPGTMLGFWSHFASQSPGAVFTLLWGFPFLVSGLGYSHEVASTLLAVLVGTGFVAGPLLGILSARFPLRRSNLVLTAVVMMMGAWAAVLLPESPPPFWLVCVLVVTLGIGGPGSLIGFDFARQFNPLRSLGSATGFVNVGGFLATFITMFLMGIVLDLMNEVLLPGDATTGLFSWPGFRAAFAVQFLVVGAGVGAMLSARRRTRRRMHEEEGITVAPLWVVLVRNRKRRSGGGSSGQSMQ